MSLLVGFCLLLACLLASAGVSHAESNWRVLASAGRSFPCQVIRSLSLSFSSSSSFSAKSAS